jgi:hypothetical protein
MERRQVQHLVAALKNIAEGCKYRLRKGEDIGDRDTLEICNAALMASSKEEKLGDKHNVRVIPRVPEKTENELMWEANGFFKLPDDGDEDSVAEGLAFASPDSDTTTTKQAECSGPTNQKDVKHE